MIKPFSSSRYAIESYIEAFSSLYVKFKGFEVCAIRYSNSSRSSASSSFKCRFSSFDFFSIAASSFLY